MADKSLRILLVDDDASQRDQLSALLSHTFGYQVDVAAMAAEARVFMRHTTYQIGVIADMQEPGHDDTPACIVLLDELKQQSPDAQVIMLLSDRRTIRLPVLESRAYCCLSKPVQIEELAHQIGRAAEYTRLHSTVYGERLVEQLITTLSGMIADHDLQTLLPTIVSSVQRLGAERVGCYLLAEDESHLEGVADVGIGPMFTGHTVEIRSPLTLELLREVARPCLVAGGHQLTLHLDTWLLPDAPAEWAYVPLLMRDTLLGLLVFDNAVSGQPLSAATLKLTGLFAQQVAAMIANVRLHAVARGTATKALSQVHSIRAIQEVTAAICSLRPQAEVLETICRAAVDLFGVDHSGLVIFDPAGSMGEVVCEYPKIGTVGFQIPVAGVRAEEDLVSAHQPLVVEDVAAAEQLGPVRELLGRFKIRSILIVPVVYQNQVLGSFSLDAIDQQRAFGAEELDLCTIFASQVAVALENQRVYHQLQDKAGQLEDQASGLRTLYRLSQELTGTLALDSVLNLIAAQTAQLVGAQRALFLLVDPETLTLVQHAGYGYEPDELHSITNEELHDGVSGWVLRYKEAVLIKDARVDPRNRGEARRKAKRLRTKSLLVAPLLRRDQVIGTLTAVNSEDAPDFKPADLEKVVLFANQAAIAIDNARLYHDTELRRWLLTELDEATSAIRAEHAFASLRRTIVRRAVRLSRGTVSLLLDYRAELDVLAIADVSGMPQTLQNQWLVRADHLIWSVARSGRPQIATGSAARCPEEPLLADYPFTAMLAVPLLHLSAVSQVLVVATTGAHPFTSVHQEILERFARAAAEMLHTPRLVTFERRVFSRMAILYQVSAYLQESSSLDYSLHAILTGITAGYGLGFNRAALLLVEPDQRTLVGAMGIGHLEQTAALHDWEQMRDTTRDDFRFYREQLEAGKITPTPLGVVVRNLRLQLPEQGTDPLSRAFRERRPLLVAPDDLAQLPPEFIALVRPETELAIVPLLGRSEEVGQQRRTEKVGLLIADNKFLRLDISREELDALVPFAHMAAVAIENSRLVKRVQHDAERLAALYHASNLLIRPIEPRQVLEEATRVKASVGAAWLTILLIDRVGQVRDLITNWENELPLDDPIIWPNGTSMRVLETRQAVPIPDATQAAPGMLHPQMVAAGVAAALCLPLLRRDSAIGVLWLHYDTPHYFTTPELEALQLFANHVAVTYDNARRITELEYIRDAAQALASAAELPAVLKQTVESARTLLQADSAVIWGFDDIRRTFVTDKSFAAGVPSTIWQVARHEPPLLREGGTADTILKRDWVGVENVADEQRYGFMGQRTRSFLRRVGAHSFQGIALKVDDERLGILYVNYAKAQVFSPDEQQIARTFANHAALALKKAKLLAQLNRVRAGAEAVANALVLGGDLPTTLQRIADQVRSVLECDAVTIYVYEPATGETWHPPVTSGVRFPERVHELIALPKDALVLQMLARDEPYAVDDTREDPLFRERRFTVEERIASCLAIPLRVGSQKVGVLFVNYRVQHHFTVDDRANSVLFANQVATAIHNAQLYAKVRNQRDELRRLYAEVRSQRDKLQRLYAKVVIQHVELKQTKKRLARRNAIVIMGLIGSSSVHRLVGRSGVLEDAAQRIEQHLERRNSTRDIMQALTVIKEIARGIKESRIDSRRVSGSETELLPINQMIQERIDRCTRSLAPPPVEFITHFAIDDAVTVQINRHLLRELLDILIDNAVEAMQQSAEQKLEITTRRVEQGVEIVVRDSGPGVPEAMRPRLFHEQIEKPDREKGLGVGLVLAQTIVEAYEGRIAHVLDDHPGATFVVWLPCYIPNVAKRIEQDLGRDNSTATIAQLLPAIKEIAHDLMEAVSDSRHVSGSETELLPINQMIQERIDRCTRSLAPPPVEFITHFAIDDAVTVQINRHLLRELLDILIDNAVEAMQQSAEQKLEITTRRVEQGVEIVVRDSGPGVPEAMRPRLFHEQIEKPDREKGLGVGLVLAQTIVEAYEGRITYVLNDRPGATFVVWLPCYVPGDDSTKAESGR